LRRAEAEFQSGQRIAAKLISAVLEVLASEPEVALNYLEVVDPDTLESVGRITQTALLALAARVGSTRLIDNALLIP
jgi:pantoate ligase/cytidylate kinase